MNKTYITIGASIVVFFLALFVYTKLAGPIPFSVNSVTTTKQNLFQSQGTGKVTAIPNTAEISFGVTKTAPTVADAQNQVNTATQNILTSLKNLGVDTKDITTTDYSVNPQYNFNTGGQTITGYTVTQNIDVKLSPIEKANKAVDVATADGANLVGGISFTVDDATQKSLTDKARKMAVEDAKQKAQSLADAAGIKLGRIIDVQETTDQPIIRPLVMNMAAGSAKSDAVQTQLPAGQSIITSSVTISYETY